jgi:hypothetical protein
MILQCLRATEGVAWGKKVSERLGATLFVPSSGSLRCR